MGGKVKKRQVRRFDNYKFNMYKIAIISSSTSYV